MTTDLPVTDLRTAIMKLLDAVQEKFGPVLHLEDDLYWNAPLKAAITVDTAPALDLGSVVDDARSVSAFGSSKEEFVSIWHESNHIAGVLRSIARLDLPHE